MILKNIKALLEGKRPVVVAPDETVRSVAGRMAEENQRAAVVVHEGAVIGVVSEKDIVHKCVACGRDAAATAVSSIMTAGPMTIDADDTIAHAIGKMLEGSFHHLPVVEGGRLIGMIYSDDIPEQYRLLYDHYKTLKGEI